MTRLMTPSGWKPILSETVQDLDEDVRELVFELTAADEKLTEDKALDLIKKFGDEINALNKDYDDEVENIINEMFDGVKSTVANLKVSSRLRSLAGKQVGKPGQMMNYQNNLNRSNKEKPFDTAMKKAKNLGLK